MSIENLTGQTLGQYELRELLGVWYTLRIEVEGSRVDWYVNGTRVAFIEDSEIQRGDFGINTSERTEIYLDDVSVVNLTSR